MILHCIVDRSILFVLAALFLQIAVIDLVTAENVVSDDGFTYTDIQSAVTLDCGVNLALNSTDNLVTRWFKGGKPLETSNARLILYASNRFLLITGFIDSDEGDYSCTQSDGFGSLVSEVTKLRASTRGALVLELALVTEVSLGDSLRLACPVQQWKPLPTVRWYRDAEVINSSQSVSNLPGGVIHLTNMSNEDGGVYHCTAETDSYNTANSDAIIISVNTTGERSYEVLASPPLSLDVLSGRDLAVECFINSVNDEKAVWQRKVVEKDVVTWNSTLGAGIVVTDGYLWLRNVTSAVGGEYRCNIQSAEGDTLASFPTTINVVSPPSFASIERSSFTKLTVESGNIGELSCGDVEGNPKPIAMWHKNGQPLDICHNINLSKDNTLNIEQVSRLDTGYYQCVFSNQYGSLSSTYKFIASIDANLPPIPRITRAKFVGPESIEVQWENENTAAPFNNIAIHISFSMSVCEPHFLAMSTVLEYNDAICHKCPTGPNDCCRYAFEVPKADTDYRLQVTAVNMIGQKISLPVTAVATRQARDNHTTFGVEAIDFGSVILIQWDSVDEAAGYRVTLEHETNSGLIKSELIERSLEQNYTVIEGFNKNLTLSVDVEAVHVPVIYQQRVELNISKPHPAQIQAPNVAVIALNGEDGIPGVFAYWNDVPGVDYFHVWYKCDGMETLLQQTKTSITVLDVSKRCTFAVAPVVEGKPQLAGVARYDRWCKKVAIPIDVSVKSHYPVDANLPPDTYAVLVEWDIGQSNDTDDCEVNYLVRWRLVDSLIYLEANSQVQQDNFAAVVKGLRSNSKYVFQVMSFTNVSDDTLTSVEVSYNVGPPQNARNLAVGLGGFPHSTVVTWDHALPIGDVNLYVIRLYVREGGHWSSFNSTTLTVRYGVTLEVEYKSLKFGSVYNVTVNGVNEHGPGNSSSRVFSTPPKPYDDTQIGSDSGGVSDSPSGLSESHLAIVIGVVISCLLIFISALLCIFFKKKFKNSHRHRRARRRTAHMQNSYDTRPLTVHTNPPHYQLSTSIRGVHSAPPRLVDDDVESGVPPLKNLGSPLQHSIKATSGQDSGIGGTAEDHRSSQDLGEYEVDSGELMDSSLSLSSSASSHERARAGCGCDEADCNVAVRTRSARTHTESECDSLLTDTHKLNIDHKTSTDSALYSGSSSKLNQLSHGPTSNRPSSTSDTFGLAIKPPDDQNNFTSCHSLTNNEELGIDS